MKHSTTLNFFKNSYKWFFLGLVILGLVAIGFFSRKTTVVARTQPNNDSVSKPDGLLIHLPFESGVSSHLQYNSYGSSSLHDGIDYYAIDFNINGGKVYPVASGTIVYSRRVTGYGNVVFIRHDPDFPNYVSVYAHLASVSITEGQPVDVSTQIGTEGNTDTKKQHLHFAMRYCNEIQVGIIPTNSSGNPNNCKAVVPEPFLGVDVYEGYNYPQKVDQKRRYVKVC